EGVDHGLVTDLGLPVFLHGGLPGGERLGELGQCGGGGPVGLALPGRFAVLALVVRARARLPRLGEVAAEPAEQGSAGGADAVPGHGHGGDPAAVGGGRVVLEVGGHHCHGAGDVGAEVAGAGASVPVTGRIGGA